MEETKYRSKTIIEIDEIDTDKLRSQALNMLDDKEMSEIELQNKYNYLFSTTKNLFNMIIRDKNDKESIKLDLKDNLNFILNKISTIKKTKVFDDNTIKSVNDTFSSKYIPEKFLKK